MTRTLTTDVRKTGRNPRHPWSVYVNGDCYAQGFTTRKEARKYIADEYANRAECPGCSLLWPPDDHDGICPACWARMHPRSDTVTDAITGDYADLLEYGDALA